MVRHREQPHTSGESAGQPRREVVSGLVEPVLVCIAPVGLSEPRSASVVVQDASAEFSDLIERTELPETGWREQHPFDHCCFPNDSAGVMHSVRCSPNASSAAPPVVASQGRRDGESAIVRPRKCALNLVWPTSNSMCDVANVMQLRMSEPSRRTQFSTSLGPYSTGSRSISYSIANWQ